MSVQNMNDLLQQKLNPDPKKVLKAMIECIDHTANCPECPYRDQYGCFEAMGHDAMKILGKVVGGTVELG